MPYRVEDGKGSRSRSEVTENKIREFAVSVPKTNYMAGETIEREFVVPSTGIYDVAVVSSVAGSGGSLLYLVNNDPDNFVIVDRIYSNPVVSATTLTDTSTYIQILMGSILTSGTGSILYANNTNQAIVDIQPNVTMLNGAVTSGGAELSRKYPNTNRVYFQEQIFQESDGIILGKGNSIELFLATTSSTYIDVSLRFGMMSRDNMEF